MVQGFGSKQRLLGKDAWADVKPSAIKDAFQVGTPKETAYTQGIKRIATALHDGSHR